MKIIKYMHIRIILILLISLPFTTLCKSDTDNYTDVDRNIDRAVEEGDYETIWKLSKDPDPEIRIRAMNGFMELGTEKSRSKIVDMLFDIDPTVRAHSAELLEKIGWKPKTDFVAVQYYIAKRDWKKVVSYQESAIDHIATRLKKDTDPQIRKEAAEALGEIPSETTYNILNEAYRHDKDPQVRLTAYQSMRKIQKVMTEELVKDRDNKGIDKRYILIGILILMAILTTLIFILPLIRKRGETG